MIPIRPLLLAGLCALAAPACGGAPDHRTIADPVPSVSLTERRRDVSQPEVLPPSETDRRADTLSDPVRSRPLTETDPAPVDAANDLAPATTERAAPTPAALEPCDDEDDDCRLDRLGTVTLGWLKEGLTRKAIEAKLGAPATVGKAWEEGATGEWVTDCGWPAAGVGITFSANTEGGAQSARGITVTAPFAEKTRRGIGIGSTEAEVRATYGTMLDPRPDGIVAGSVYGGIFFGIDDQGRVNRIFVGPGAE